MHRSFSVLPYKQEMGRGDRANRGPAIDRPSGAETQHWPRSIFARAATPRQAPSTREAVTSSNVRIAADSACPARATRSAAPACRSPVSSPGPARHGSSAGSPATPTRAGSGVRRPTTAPPRTFTASTTRRAGVPSGGAGSGTSNPRGEPRRGGAGAAGAVRLRSAGLPQQGEIVGARRPARVRGVAMVFERGARHLLHHGIGDAQRAEAAG